MMDNEGEREERVRRKMIRRADKVDAISEKNARLCRQFIQVLSGDEFSTQLGFLLRWMISVDSRVVGLTIRTLIVSMLLFQYLFPFESVAAATLFDRRDVRLKPDIFILSLEK